MIILEAFCIPFGRRDFGLRFYMSAGRLRVGHVLFGSGMVPAVPPHLRQGVVVINASGSPW